MSANVIATPSYAKLGGREHCRSEQIRDGILIEFGDEQIKSLKLECRQVDRECRCWREPNS